VPAPIDPRERLSRFVLNKDHIKPARRVVTYRAFFFKIGTELSVSRTDGMNEDDVWAYSDEHVATPARPSVFGRADFNVEQMRAREELTALSVEPTEPPVRHAAIRQWPVDEEQRRSVAQVLAALATCVIR
jgi:hypothetical protein